MNFQSIIHQIRETITISQVISAANVVLIASTAWLGGNLGASIVENKYLEVPYQEVRYHPPQNIVRDKARRYSEFRQIVAQNVFNAEVEKEKVVEVIVEQEEEVQITAGEVLRKIIADLELLGIHYQKGRYIYCIIKSKKKKSEEIYTIGEEVFESGASVKRIFTTFGKQRVHLKMGNEVGVLTFVGTEEKEKPKPTKSVKKRTKPKSRKNKKVSSSDPEYSSDGQNFHISATEVDSHLNDFGSLLNQARMIPYFKSGKHEGFKVKAIDKGSLYEKLGLKNNDVLKAVNGETLAEAGGEKLMGLFKLLRNEREFTVEIERNGSPQVLSYYVN